MASSSWTVFYYYSEPAVNESLISSLLMQSHTPWTFIIHPTLPPLIFILTLYFTGHWFPKEQRLSRFLMACFLTAALFFGFECPFESGWAFIDAQYCNQNPSQCTLPAYGANWFLGWWAESHADQSMDAIMGFLGCFVFTLWAIWLADVFYIWKRSRNIVWMSLSAVFAIGVVFIAPIYIQNNINQPPFSYSPSQILSGAVKINVLPMGVWITLLLDDVLLYFWMWLLRREWGWGAKDSLTDWRIRNFFILMMIYVSSIGICNILCILSSFWQTVIGWGVASICFMIARFIWSVDEESSIEMESDEEAYTRRFKKSLGRWNKQDKSETRRLLEGDEKSVLNEF